MPETRRAQGPVQVAGHGRDGAPDISVLTRGDPRRAPQGGLLRNEHTRRTARNSADVAGGSRAEGRAEDDVGTVMCRRIQGVLAGLITGQKKASG